MIPVHGLKKATIERQRETHRRENVISITDDELHVYTFVTWLLA